MKSFAKPALWLSIISTLFTACAGPNIQQNSLRNTANVSVGLQHISGTLVQSDGRTPMQGATVFIENIPSSENKTISEHTLNSVAKRNLGCAKPNTPFVNFGCTDANGRFSLWINDIKSLPLTVTFQYESEIIKSQIALNELGDDIGEILFSNSDTQPKSKVAIVIDLLNPIEQMGNTDNSFSMDPLIETEFEQQFALMYDLNENDYDLEFLPLNSLFKDKDENQQLDIYNYTMIYLISDGDEELSGLTRQSKRILLDYISQGGELFITTLAVELDEPSIDQYI